MTPNEPQRLVHFTPLRYPGGKAKLAPLIKQIVSENGMVDGAYAEPFAGGAGIALQLLFQGYVSEIFINDVSLPVYAFWHAILEEPEEFQERIIKTPLTVAEWDRQKSVFKRSDPSDLFSLGFATFFLNRTNRSGVLNGGPIGGREQSGKWLIDARYNAPELAYRIRRISALANQIRISCEDALDFLSNRRKAFRGRTLVYADPPYFQKGRQLYYDYYVPEDHKALARFLAERMARHTWIVSYDDVPSIREIYANFSSASYSVPYSVRAATHGQEVMFFSNEVVIPGQLTGDTKVQSSTAA